MRYSEDMEFTEIAKAIDILPGKKHNLIDEKFTLGDFKRMYFSTEDPVLRKIVGEVFDEMDRDYSYKETSYPIALSIWLSTARTIRWRIDKEIDDDILISISPGAKNLFDYHYGYWRSIYIITASKSYDTFHTKKLVVPSSLNNIKQTAGMLLPSKYAHYVSKNPHIPEELDIQRICDSYAMQEAEGFNKLLELFEEYMDKTIIFPEHLNSLLDKCMIFDDTGEYSSYSKEDFLSKIEGQYDRADNSCPKAKSRICICKDEFCYSNKLSCPIETILNEYDKKARLTKFYTPICIWDIAGTCSDKIYISSRIKDIYLSSKKSILEEEEKERKKEEKRKAAAKKREERKKSKEEKKKEYDEKCTNPYIGPRQTNFVETDELDNIIVHYKFKRQIPDEIVSKYIRDHDYLMEETIKEIKDHKNKYKYAYGIIGACEIYGIDVSGEFGTATIILRKKDFTVTPYTDDVAHELAEQYALAGKEEKDDLLIGGPVERMMDNYLDNQFL